MAKKNNLISRIKNATRVLRGKSSGYDIRDLQRIVNYAVNKTRSERDRIKNAYSAGSVDRLREDWDTRTDTPYTEIHDLHTNIIARSRDLYKNDSTYRATINTIIDNVIGTGLWPKPRIRKVDGSLNKELNKKIEYYFNIYAKSTQWDARKKFPYIGEGQRMIFKTILLTGDVFLNAVPNTNKNSVLPISWQIFESDRLDSARDAYLRNNNESKDVAQTIHGINIDKYGAEVSYNIKGIEKAKNIGQILHSSLVDRPEQYIGLPVGVSALADLYDKHDLLEDYVSKSKAIAKVLWFLSNDNDKIPSDGEADSDGVLEINALTQMRGDSAPEQIKMPDSVSDTVAPLVKMLLHSSTSGMGTSYTTVSRDLEGVSFSGSKFIDIQEWRHYVALKDFFIYDHCVPFWEQFINFLQISGKIPELNSSYYKTNSELIYESAWVGNGKQEVDPYKERLADVVALRNGFTTLASIHNKMAQDSEETIEAIQEERANFEQKGLVFDFMVATAPVYDLNSPIEGNNEQ